MGYRVLVEKDKERRYWHNHPQAIKWSTNEGKLLIHYKDPRVVIKYNRNEWLKVEETK